MILRHRARMLALKPQGADSIEDISRRLDEHEERMADITLMLEDALRPRVDAAPDDSDP